MPLLSLGSDYNILTLTRVLAFFDNLILIHQLAERETLVRRPNYTKY
jgi:hypothetical protein